MGKVLIVGAIGAVALVVRKVLGLRDRDRTTDQQPEPVREPESAPA